MRAIPPRNWGDHREINIYIYTYTHIYIYTYTHIYIYTSWRLPTVDLSVVAIILELLLDTAASCGRGRVRCLERAKRACSSQTVLAGGQAWLRLALIRAAIWLPRTTIGRCSARRCFRLCMLCSRAGVAPGGASVLGPSVAPLTVHAAWTLP